MELARVAAVVAAAALAPAAQPPPTIVPGPITALAAAGGVVAYSDSSCSVGVWRPGSRPVVLARERNCGDETATFAHVAITSDGVYWNRYEEHNHAYTSLSRIRVGGGVPVAVFSAVDDPISALASSGATLAFATQGGEYGGGANARLWLVEDGPPHAIRSITGWMDWLAVSNGVAAVGYRNGRVEVLAGRDRITSLAPGTASRGLAFDGAKLVAMTPTRVTWRTVTGRVLASRPVASGPNGVRLVAAARGYVAYDGRDGLRVIRLRDGADRVIRRERLSAAAFASGGLVVASGRTLALVPWASLST